MQTPTKPLSFSELFLKLQEFWKNQGCSIVQPYDIPAGAGTFAPYTLLRSLDDEAWNVAYVAPSRRPTDGRYAQNPNRLGSYYQFQVIMKPNPSNIQELYLQSLEFLGLDLTKHDVRFVEDNWESPTLGAWGLGWEVWLDGMEVSQFTYFQQVGGLECYPVAVELTYGTERLAMYLQGKDSIFDIDWNETTKYAHIHAQSEYEFSKYHFEVADIKTIFSNLYSSISECKNALNASLPLAAYDQCMFASHWFNVLDARKAISVTQRQDYILEIRDLVKQVAQLYKDTALERKERIKQVLEPTRTA